MQEAASESRSKDVLSGSELARIDAYWRAANYLSAGQIYLLDTPLSDTRQARTASCTRTTAAHKG